MEQYLEGLKKYDSKNPVLEEISKKMESAKKEEEERIKREEAERLRKQEEEQKKTRELGVTFWSNRY